MDENIEALSKNIREALESADAWARLRTNIPGIYIVKIPDPKGFHVSLMFNPPDDEGEPKKRKGLYFDDLNTARVAKEAFNDPHIEVVVQAVRAANHPATSPVLDVRASSRKDSSRRY